MNGFLLLDKPEGLSSFGLVKRVRHILGVKKIGHCGTLDPLATGLMILCVGKATKVARFVLGENKAYSVDIVLGWQSTTYDREGELTRVCPPDQITASQVRESLMRFRGRVKQTPPLYSAIKYRGRPLYHYARNNVEVKPPERDVTIGELELVEFNLPRLKLNLTCSSGTYVRSLAHDLGKLLGCGGYVDALRRTKIGRFGVEQATSLAEFEKAATSVKSVELLIGIDEMLALPSVYLRERASARVGNGIDIHGADIVRTDEPLSASQIVALRSHGGNMLAVGRSLLDENKLSERVDERVIEYVRVI